MRRTQAPGTTEEDRVGHFATDQASRLREMEMAMFNIHITWENMTTVLQDCEARLRHLSPNDQRQLALWLKVDSAYLTPASAPPGRPVPGFVRELRASLPHRTQARESYWRRLGELASELYDEGWKEGRSA